MSHCCSISAGENVYVEKKENEYVIHCSPAPAPQSNIHTGFFQLSFEPEENALLAVRICNCIFRVNGRYYKLDDYNIKSYYSECELIYLKLDNHDPALSSICHEVVFSDAEDKDNPQMRHFDDPQYILLYILRIKNYRLRVESYAACSLIDTVMLPEGFVYIRKDGTLETAAVYPQNGGNNEIQYDNCVYIPGFDPIKNECVNIKVSNGGGVVWIDKNNNCSWYTTGFASSDSCTVTVTATSVGI